ncbi:hypothetical protein JG559_00155 [Enterococcus faecalis]|uniref:Uncharacterized protein n=1 Tax=Enterococcus faecalis TaxID=1351 RepID=A0A974S6E7_ENTFL|nr:hypothetical protein JG559_00155 [Enterococcus faecalis]
MKAFSSGIALQALVEELGFSTMVSAQLSFCYCTRGFGGDTTSDFRTFFKRKKISATVL